MTTIATANVDIKINQDYKRQLDSVYTNVKQFSRKVTQALKPISLALGGFGALAVKQALQQNEAASIRWAQSVRRVNEGMASVGEKILQASFAGKSLFEWMDKFAQLLSKMNKGDVQKLVDSFMLIGGVLAGLKTLTGAAGLASALGKLTGGRSGGITGKQFIAGEAASSLLGGASTLGALSLFTPSAIKDIVREKELRSLLGGIPKSTLHAEGVHASKLLQMEAGIFGAGAAAKQGFGALLKGGAYTALAAVSAGAIAAMVRGARGAWDYNKGSINNITDELGKGVGQIGFILGSMGEDITAFGSVLGRIWFNIWNRGEKGLGRKPASLDEMISGSMAERQNELDRMQAILDRQDAIYSNAATGMGWKRGMPIKDDNGNVIGYTPAFNPLSIENALGSQAAKIGSRYEAITGAVNIKGVPRFTEKEIIDMVIGDITVAEAQKQAIEKYRQDELEAQQKHIDLIKRMTDKRKDIETKQIDIQDQYEKESRKYFEDMLELEDIKKSSFAGKGVGMGFYSPEASYQAATGWTSELLDYEKQKAEFEKDKQKKLSSIATNTRDSNRNLDKMVSTWEKLAQEAEGYR